MAYNGLVRVDLQDIEEGLAKLTWVIETHSEAAWPLFVRLEKELSQLKSRQSRLNAYRDKFG